MERILANNLMSGNIDNSIRYLNINNLVEGERQVCKTALVVSVNTDKDKRGSNYISFRVKDCNANIVSCIMFNVEGITEKVREIRALINKPIEFVFEVSSFRGSYSLIVDPVIGITVISEDQIDRSLFMGKIKVDIDMLKEFSSRTNIDITCVDRFKGRSFLNVYGGRVDGFLKLYEVVMFNVLSLEGSSTVDVSSLQKVAQVTLIELYNDLVSREVSPIYVRGRYLQVLKKIQNEYVGEGLLPYYIDSVDAILSDHKPYTIYGTLVNRFINRAIQDSADLTYFDSAIPNFELTLPGGGMLLKY